MQKQLIAFLLTAFLLLGFLPACSPQPPAPPPAASNPSPSADSPPPEPDPPAPSDLPEPAAPLSPRAENLMQTIDTLCAEPRPLGSPQELAAAQYLLQQLEEYGYQGELAPFSYNISQTTLSERFRLARALTGEAFFAAAFPGSQVDGRSQNVIGRQLDEVNKRDVLVLSAHYDSTADSLGVIDNASGVAVVLEAARLLAAEDLPFAVRIVFFGGEEEILIGSRQYVWDLGPEERGRILGNISVDTLAYSAEQSFIVLSPLSLPQENAPTLASASPLAAAFLADSRVTPAFQFSLVADHMSFAAAGIDSVNFGQSIDAVLGIINSPADTYSLLQPEILPVAAQLLADTVQELAAQWPPAE